MTLRRPPTRPPAQETLPRREAPAGSVHRQHSVLQSFNYAFEGVIHVLRRERNMRFHFVIATVVLVLAFAYGVTKLELIVLLLAIAFVLLAEMVNTAVE